MLQSVEDKDASCIDSEQGGNVNGSQLAAESI